jgi:16S rRNA (guanine527-N7)-methyltransferase
MNLTGHRGPEAIARRLVLDAVAFWQAVAELGRKPERVSDLGSGAGFPGIPVSILEPDLEVVLVDSREKRHHFQRAAKRALELDNLRPRLGRIEALEPDPSDVVIAQALAAPPRALELGIGWARPGGLIVIPGVEQPPDPGPHPAIATHGTVRYRVPLEGATRTLWWGEVAL